MRKQEKYPDKDTKELFKAIFKLKNINEATNFFRGYKLILSRLFSKKEGHHRA